MHTLTTVLLVCAILVVCAPTAHAFGAGDIPDFSYLNDKAFRHGDIEGILETLAKTAGGAASGGGLLGFASSILSKASGGEKFGRMDIKRVYFGNWLRDYSQAMDIAGLSKLSADTLVMIVSLLGFMTFGFATEEFEVTPDRLGVYLPVEHIDNPKGYAEKEGDARQFHPKLRPPVDPRELDIDERTGMKNYMATEDEGWDTSTAHIRRTLEACIEHGRRAQGREGDDLWEAYRLLGTGLHTLEDLLAHSNWCEIALRKMGHSEVFCHVGDDVTVETPNGTAPPLVTGTFGSADFIHSLMGEATDHISEASVTDLYSKMKDSGDSNSSISSLKNILSKLPIGGGSEKAQEAEDMKQKAYDFNPDDYAPEDVQKQLLQILQWRDGVYRDIIKKIEMIPGLNDLIDQLTNALNAYIYTILAPWLTPIMQQVTGALGEGSKAVIDSDDQYEVFTNSNASDPSHSILSKDHFGLILNEPAGKIAQIVVENSVNLIVQAWFNNEDSGRVVDDILEAFHHPYYASGSSRIQSAMMDQMQRWFGGLGEEEGNQTIEALTKESVREGKNKRLGSADASGEPGAEPTYSQQSQSQNQGGYSSGGYGGGRQNSTQSSANTRSYSQRNDEDSYGQRTESYGEQGYSSNSRRNDEDSYGRSQTSSRYSTDDYSSHREESSYGGRRESEGYGRSEDRYSSRTEISYPQQNENNDYGSGGGYGRNEYEGYGRESRPETSSYETSSYETSSYETPGDSYGRHRGEDNERHGHHGRPHQQEQENQQEGYQPSYDQARYEQGGSNFERRGGYEGGESRQDYGGGDDLDQQTGGYGGGRDIGESGYGSGYGNDETFGAERLNLEDEGGRHHGRHRGGGRRRSPPREEYY